MDVAVVLIIFNRPDTTKRVFEEIRRVQPSKLFVIADGPREAVREDQESCRAARDIINDVDWKCEVHTNFSDVNMGGPKRVPSGLDWVFNFVDKAIILEDDCLPNPDFFTFSEELLHKYQNDERVMMISGNNFELKNERIESSYYFSKYTITWGWATWRRAWNKFSKTRAMESWPEMRNSEFLKGVLQKDNEFMNWYRIFERMYVTNKHHWDYLWTLTCWMNNGLSIVPKKNLVSNIGWGEGATNTTNAFDKRANLPTYEIEFPLVHPEYIVFDHVADNCTNKEVYDVGLDEEAHMQNRLYSISLYKELWLDLLLEKRQPISAVLKSKGKHNVVIFGTKEISKYLLTDIRQAGLNVIAFLDNYWKGKDELLGIPVHSPKWLQENISLVDTVILSNKSEQDDLIKRQLTSIAADIHIVTWRELIRMNMRQINGKYGY